MLKYAWIIPLIPSIAFIVILLSGKRMNSKGFFVSIGAVGLSFLLSILTFFEVANGKSVEIHKTWLLFGSTNLDVGILVDSLAAVMLLVVTSVSLLVQIYSIGYMHGEKRYGWYFAAISLFTAAMLSVILANNYLQMYMSWEVMGLCSYLLIGFWFEKKSASDAAKKAFIVTRIGDVGFFLAIAALIAFAGSTNFTSLSKMIEAGKLGLPLLTAVGILLFAGAMGKSAQFPLHVWLPDAMEGPTPGSALIHAATMVAAGVYLIARSLFIIEAAFPSAFSIIAIIGTITALMAATIAVTMSDIKKVLAYSTISQLGYMMVALGVGGYVAGVFHLVTHAFFKALLFLGAGSIIHSTGTQNMYELGGLSKKMKITYATFLIASLSIAGIFPLSGFWSKDEILADAFKGGHYLIFGILLFTAFLTAFYMFRLVFLVFFGRPRNHKIHAHESPPVMSYPLIALAIPAALIGLVGSPFLGNAFSSFVASHGEHASSPNYLLMFISVAVAVSGILLAWVIYSKKRVSESSIKQRISFLYLPASNKYYFDEIYMALFVRPVIGLAALLNRFDLQIIDRVIRGMAIVALRASGIAAIFDKRAIDDAINALGGATVRVSTGTSIFDNQVIDGVVNALGGATVKVSAETSAFDNRAIDGVVNAIGGATIVTSAETNLVEHKVIDRFVNGIGKTVQWLSRRLRVIHTGNILNYAVYIFIAELAAIMIALAIAWLTR